MFKPDASRILNNRATALLAVVLFFLTASLVGSSGVSAFRDSPTVSLRLGLGVCDQIAATRQEITRLKEAVRSVSDEVAKADAQSARQRDAGEAEVASATDAVVAAIKKIIAAQESLKKANQRTAELLPSFESITAKTHDAKLASEFYKGKAYQTALELREELWKDRRVLEVRLEIRKLENDIKYAAGPNHIKPADELKMAGVGPAGVGDIEILRQRVANSDFDNQSRIATLVREISAAEETEAAGQSKDKEKLASMKAELARIRRLLPEKIDQLQKLRAETLAAALEAAAKHLTEQFSSIITSDAEMERLRTESEQARKEYERAEAELKTIGQQYEQAQKEVAEQEKLLAQATKEKEDAARVASAARQKKETRVGEAERSFQEATQKLAAAKSDLAQGERRIKELEPAKQALEDQVKNLIEAGRTAGRNSSAANRAARKDDCLKNLSSARGLFSSARDLLDANPCLDPTLLQRVNQYLALVERTDCQGDHLGPPPKEGGGFKDAGPSVDKSSRTGPAQPQPPDPNNPHVRRAQAAIANCDFQRARASLDQYQPADPNDPWMAAKYKEIFSAQEKLDSTEALLAQAADILQQSEPSRDQILYASTLVKEARNRAPGCISQKVSGLTPLVNDAMAAAAQRERERSEQQRENTRAAIAAALTGIGDAIAQVQQARDGSGPSSTSGQPAGGGGNNPGGCGGCLITGAGHNKRATYVFQKSYLANGCQVTAYSIFSVSPTDDEGRPADHLSPQEEAQFVRGYGQKKYGPSSSYQEAMDWIKSQCPKPKAVNVLP